MGSRSGFALLATLFVALACSGWRGPPRVVALTPSAGECGAWSAEVEVADVRGQAVTLRMDGAPVKRWADVWGDHRWTVEGQGPPAALATLEVVIEDTPSQQKEVVMLAGSVAVRVAPERLVVPVGEVPRFEVTVSSTCPLDGLRWWVSTGSFTDEGEVTGERTVVTLREHPPGAHPVTVEVRAGELRGSAKASLVVGDADLVDLDGDGFLGDVDCNDDDAGVNPAVPERPDPNGRDDNCDGRVDEGTVVYDDDGDGRSEVQGDCNDLDATAFPGATEVSNCRDEDCDGEVDEGVPFRPWPDDGFEQQAGGPYRVPGQPRRVELPLALVSRDAQDVEEIEFWSQDGDWDSWGIDVVARRLPADSVFGVQIRRFDGSVVASGTLARDGDVVRAEGRPFRNDSGVYQVIVRPNRLYADGCPVELYVESR